MGPAGLSALCGVQGQRPWPCASANSGKPRRASGGKPCDASFRDRRNRYGFVPRVRYQYDVTKPAPAISTSPPTIRNGRMHTPSAGGVAVLALSRFYVWMTCAERLRLALPLAAFSL